MMRDGIKRLIRLIPDSLFLRYKFYKTMNQKLDLNHPKTFNEKIQWLKLFDRNPDYPAMADKAEVKRIVSEKLGEEYVIPTLGVWDHFDEIDFDSLPNQFVLKCTHDSGSYIISKDKNILDLSAARTKLETCLNKNFYWWGREWVYKDIKPRILAEQYMCNDDSVPLELQEFSDYKFYCFNGVVDCVMVCIDRAAGDTKYYFFDRDWQLLRINRRGLEASKDFSLPKPQKYDEMFEAAEKLSKGIPFVRVDLYQSNGRVYFGEMTFYPDAGFDKAYLPETDLYFGSKIDLSLAYNNRNKRRKNEQYRFSYQPKRE